MDGVDLLYAGSDRIDQSGSFNDFRLSATKEWEPGHAFELMVLRNTTDMRHDVRLTTGIFNPALRVWKSTNRTDVKRHQQITAVWLAEGEKGPSDSVWLSGTSG